MNISIKHEGLSLTLATKENETVDLSGSLALINDVFKYFTKAQEKACEDTIKDVDVYLDDFEDIVRALEKHEPAPEVKAQMPDTELVYKFDTSKFSNMINVEDEASVPEYMQALYLTTGEAPTWEVNLYQMYRVFTKDANRSNGYTIPVKCLWRLDNPKDYNKTFTVFENTHGDRFAIQRREQDACVSYVGD